MAVFKQALAQGSPLSWEAGQDLPWGTPRRHTPLWERRKSRPETSVATHVAPTG